MFGHHEDAHDAVYNGKKHHSDWTHELIAGAAAFAAMKKHEDGKEGGKHKLAKEAFVALAAVEADKLFESKGLDFIDRQKAKHEAKKQAEHIYDQKYA